MGLFDLIPFLGGSREADTIGLIQEQMLLVHASVESTRDAVEALARGDKKLFEEKRDVVNALEDRIDGITRKIEENLYSGAFLAVSRSRILDFAEEVDDIADAAKDVVNIGDVMAYMQVGEDFHALLHEHMEATLECVGYLGKCVENINNPKRLLEYIPKVREQEHRVDTIASQLFRFIRSPTYDAKNFILISKMIEFMDTISDRSEDASDTLKLITLMHKP
jgi:predicted phosphate transport protein (TIGR00153 family)